MKRVLGIIVCTLVLSACAKEEVISEESADRPAALVAFESTLPVHYLWSAQLNLPGKRQRFSLPPVALEGKIFEAEAAGRIACYDAMNGGLIWEYISKDTLTGGVGVGEGVVVAGTEKGDVIALDVKQGQFRWRTTLSSEILAAPQIANGKVVVAVNDGKIVGLDASTGQRIWVNANGVPSLSLRGTGQPVIQAERVVAGFANGRLAAINLHNGKRLWETTVAVAKGRSEIERLVDIDSTPHIADGVIYSVSYQGQVAALTLENGQVLWTREMSSFRDIALDENRVYVSDASSHIWALDRKSGATLWRQEKMSGRMITAPVVQRDYLVVGDFEGYLHWMMREDGRFVARVHIDEADRRSKVLGQVTLSEDEEGNAKFKDKLAISVEPSVVDDRLYVRDTKGLLAAYRIGS